MWGVQVVSHGQQKKKKYKEKKALPISAFDLIEQTAIFVKKQ